jgi:hypothetical protein
MPAREQRSAGTEKRVLVWQGQSTNALVRSRPLTGLTILHVNLLASWVEAHNREVFTLLQTLMCDTCPPHARSRG